VSPHDHHHKQEAQVLNQLKVNAMELGLLAKFGSYPKATTERIAFRESPQSQRIGTTNKFHFRSFHVFQTIKVIVSFLCLQTTRKARTNNASESYPTEGFA